MPFVAGAGVGIADALVLIVMVALAAMLWVALQARTPAGRIPVVGVQAVGLIDGIRQGLTQLAFGLEQFITAQVTVTQDLWTRFVHQVLDPAIGWIQDAVVRDGLWIENVAKGELVALGAGLASTEALVVQQIAPQLGQLQLAEGQLELYARGVLAAELVAAEGALATALNRVSVLESEALDLGGRLVRAEQALTALLEFLPLLQQLGAFETTTGAGVGALARTAAEQAGRVQGLSTDLSRLLPLVGLASLSAVAIAELIRIAKNPCGICQGLDLSGVEARLESLELFGQI